MQLVKWGSARNRLAGRLLGMAIGLVLVAACGGNAEPTATPVPLPTETSTTVPTSVPTATPEPTPVPPEPTPIPTEEPLEQPLSPLAPESPLAVSESPLAAPDAESYADPFAYCAAVGTIDAPDARYTGSTVPDALAEGLRLAFETPDTPLEFYRTGTVWRCMDGEVYACTVGANLPCEEQADLSEEPTEAMVVYCEEEPDSDFIPMVVTGRATVYQWSCVDGEPQAGEAIATVDSQGFLADIWYRIEAEE